MTATEAEALVRKHWERVYVSDNRFYWYGKTQYSVWIRQDIDLPMCDSETEAWLAAAAFTEQRREEIAEFQRAQDWLDEFGNPALSEDDVYAVPTLRLLVDEKLDALRQGWKEASDGG